MKKLNNSVHPSNFCRETPNKPFHVFNRVRCLNFGLSPSSYNLTLHWRSSHYAVTHVRNENCTYSRKIIYGNVEIRVFQT